MPHHKKGTTLGTWNITLGPTLATKQFVFQFLDDFFFSNFAPKIRNFIQNYKTKTKNSKKFQKFKLKKSEFSVKKHCNQSIEKVGLVGPAWQSNGAATPEMGGEGETKAKPDTGEGGRKGLRQQK